MQTDFKEPLKETSYTVVSGSDLIGRLDRYRFLGKVMSEYISVCIREGERRLGVLDKGFNYDRWAKTFNKSKQV